MGKGGKKGVWKNSGPHVLVFPSSLGIGGSWYGGTIWKRVGELMVMHRGHASNQEKPLRLPSQQGSEQEHGRGRGRRDREEPQGVIVMGGHPGLPARHSEGMPTC